MAELPRVPRRMGVLTQAPNMVDPSVYGAPYRAAAKALDGIGDTVEAVQKKQDEDALVGSPEAAAKLVTKDADGNIRIAPIPEVDKASRYTMKLARTGFEAAIAPEISSKVGDIRRKNEGKIDAFNTEIGVYRDQLLARQPDAQLRLSVETILDREISQHRGGLLNAADTRGVERDYNAIKTRIDTLDNEMAAMARQEGGTATADYQEKAKQYNTLWQELAGNPRIKVSPAEADRALARAQSRHRGEAIIGQAERLYHGPGGLKAAEEFAEQAIWDPKLDLEPSERRLYYNAAVAQLRVLTTERRQALQAERLAARDMAKRLDDGADISDRDVNDQLDRLAELGDISTHLRLSDARTSARYMKPYRDLPDAAQAEQLQGLREGGRSDDATYFTKVSGAESLGSGGDQARAKTSSALGRFQFVKKTWIDLMTTHEPDLVRTLSRSELLALRSDPGMATRMMGHLTRANEAALRNAGLPVNDMTRYLAHFLGAGGAVKLLKADWDQSAATLLPGAAKDNREVFYGRSERGGDPMTVGQIVAWATRKMGMRVTPEMLRGASQEVTGDLKRNWSAMKEGLGKGVLPSEEDWDYVHKATPLVADRDLRNEIADTFNVYDRARRFERQPLAAQDADVTALEAEGRTRGMDRANQSFLEAAQKIRNATRTGLNEDPLGLMESRNLLRAPLGALDLTDGNALTQELRNRERNAGFIRLFSGRGDIPALRPAELEAFRTFMRDQGTLPENKAAVLGLFQHTLGEDTFHATMAKIGEAKDSAIYGYIGGLFAKAPPVAESIIRGLDARAKEPRLVPTKDEEWGNLLAAGFPLHTLVPELNGTYANMRMAIEGRYADLANQLGDNSGKLNEDRLDQAVADVTGGVVEWHGRKVIAPERGLNDYDLDGVMRSLTDADLRGAITPAGTRVTAADIQRSEVYLRAVHDGIYAIEMQKSDGSPFYVWRLRDSDTGIGIQTNARAGPDFERLYLDLRGRKPDAALSRSTREASPFQGMP